MYILLNYTAKTASFEFYSFVWKKNHCPAVHITVVNYEKCLFSDTISDTITEAIIHSGSDAAHRKERY